MSDNNGEAQCYLCRSSFTKFYLANMPFEEFEFPLLSYRVSKYNFFVAFLRHLNLMGYRIPKYDDILFFFSSNDESEPDGSDSDYMN